MTTETLVCESCDESFERTVARGRKPKQCPDCKASDRPKSKARPKAEPKPFEPQVIDMGTGLRDKKKVPPIRIVIPDNAVETRVSEWLVKYDRVIIDGTLFEVTDVVQILNDTDPGDYRILDYTVNDVGHKYFGLFGLSGTYAGKYRFVDPWRVVK